MEPLPLHDLHASRGAQFQVLRGREVVLRYGDLALERSALAAGAGLLDLSFREGVWVSGPDASSFLQGMVTQDLRPLPPNGATYTALLTAKGAMVSDARVVRREGGLLLDVEPGFGEATLAFLGRFLISEEAELEPERSGVWLGLHGPLAHRVVQDLLGAAPDPEDGLGALLDCGGEKLQAVSWRRFGVPGVELFVPRAQLLTLYRALEAVPCVTQVGLAASEVARVEAGVPRFGQDMGETTLPLEARLERAISYTKGCYIGQEVIARATYRGHMNRKLCALSLGGEPVAEGASLHAGERKVGFLTSVVWSEAALGHLGLGYVHRDFLAPGTLLRVLGRDAGATVLPGYLPASGGETGAP